MNLSAYSESTTEVKLFRIADAHSGLAGQLVPELSLHALHADTDFYADCTQRP